MGKNKNRNWGNSNGKNDAADNAKKILSGVLFMAACFLSVFVLMAYNDVIWLVAIMFVALMAAAYFFLGQLFNKTEERIDDLVKAQEALEAVKEEDRKEADAAFKRQVEEQIKSMDRTTRAMFMTMKKSAETQAIQLANMENRIDKAIDEQNAGIKTIIKYNKENARQMAKSEKDALEKMAASISDELRVQGRGQAQPVQYVQMPMAQPVYQQPVMQEPVMQESVMQEPVMQEPVFEAPELEIPEEPVFEEPVLEETVTEEPVAEEPAGEGMLSEDEIAAMLAGAVSEEAPIELNTEEPVAEEPSIEIPEEPTFEEPVMEEPVFEAPELEIPEEPVVEEPVAEEPVAEEPVSNGLLSEDEIAAMLAGAMDDVEAENSEEESAAPAATSEADLAAATGVDLSDPNAALSPDDIAKLFAAAGN